MFEKILHKLKTLLKDSNSIHAAAEIDSSVEVKGSSISAFVEIGANSVVRNSVLNNTASFGKHNTIQDSKISGNFVSGEHCKIFGVTFSGSINVGNYSSLWGPNLDMQSGKQQIFIGNFCSIARNVTFQTFNHNHKKISTYFIGKNLFKENWDNERVSKGDIIVHNDVWIGSHCVVLGGVTIHNGAIVAANSVVTKDVPAYSIVAGTPAKVIGYRFEQDQIQRIQELQWWNWSVEKILRNKHLFTNEINENDLNQLINN